VFGQVWRSAIAAASYVESLRFRPRPAVCSKPLLSCAAAPAQLVDALLLTACLAQPACRTLRRLRGEPFFHSEVRPGLRSRRARRSARRVRRSGVDLLLPRAFFPCRRCQRDQPFARSLPRAADRRTPPTPHRRRRQPVLEVGRGRMRDDSTKPAASASCQPTRPPVRLLRVAVRSFAVGNDFCRTLPERIVSIGAGRAPTQKRTPFSVVCSKRRMREIIGSVLLALGCRLRRLTPAQPSRRQAPHRIDRCPGAYFA